MILRLRRVPVMDATGANALDALIDRLERQRVLVMLSGLQAQPRELLERMGVLTHLAERGGRVFETSEAAIDAARVAVAPGAAPASAG